MDRAKLAEALYGNSGGLRERLEKMVRTNYFTPFLVDASQNLQSKQVMGLAQATKFWVDCLADFLVGIPRLLQEPEKYVASVFCRPEQTLSAVYFYPDGSRLRIRGRYDCLLFNPEAKRAELFEFKGFKASDPMEELAQALVYAWLIYTATGSLPSARVIYLEDDAPLVYSPDAIKKMLDNLPHLFNVARQVLDGHKSLPPASSSTLCKICPFDSQCDGDWGKRATSHAVSTQSLKKQTKQRRIPPKADNAEAVRNEDEGRRKMAQLLEALRQLRVFADDEGYIYGPCFIRLKIRPVIEKGITVKKVENTARDLQVALALPSPPLIQPQSGYVSVDVPRNDRQILTMEEIMRKAEATRPNSEAAFPLGLDIDGRVFWVDLAEPIMTSTLIGGTSGSGKSVLLRSIVIGLTHYAPPGSALFTLIDPKRVTFTDMNGLKVLDEGMVIADPGSGMQKLIDLVDEMEDRYLKMERARVSDIVDYNARGGDFLQRRVVIIDEYADMIVSSQARENLEVAVQRISQKGRAAGIHLILATQRPDATVVTGIIKANLQLRIALKVMSQTNSQIILDEGGAQYLLGHGDMLVGGSVPIQRLQGALASPDDLQQ